MESKRFIISTKEAGGLMLVAVMLLIFPSTTGATHGVPPATPVYTFPYEGISGEERCNRGNDLDEGIKPPVGFSGGLHVPVKDFEAEAYLKAILTNTGGIEGDTRAIRYYLRDLCYKEFSLDHTIQNAWAQTIGAFTEWTVKFINTGYAGNPLYVSNPYLYYLRVDDDVFDVLYNEIESIPTSVLPDSLKVPLLKNLALKRSDRLFPELIAPSVSDDEIEKLIKNFTDGGGWNKWLAITTDPVETFPKLVALADAELAQRRETARIIEAEKLAWGRGFFSLEECDLTVWTLGNQDRRNCRIFTPGSLIQEEAALVLGSALRQMELADEYEEFISLGAFNAMNSVLNNNGIRRNTVGSTAVVPPLPGGITPFTGAQTTSDPPRVGFLEINEGAEGPDAQDRSIPDIFQQRSLEEEHVFEFPF